MKEKVLIILFAILTGMTTFAQPLSIEIKLDKKVYLTYEPIMLLIEIKNETNSPVTYHLDRFSSNFNPIVKHNGIKIECYSAGASYSGIRSVILDSKSSQFIFYQVLEITGCPNSRLKKGVHLEHLIPGEYTIELEYNFVRLDLVVNSNKLKFKVKDPKDELYRAQRNKFIALMNDVDNYRNLELFTKKINEIISLDNQSPYSLLAKNWLLYKLKGLGKETEYRKIMENLCNSNHESFVTLNWIMYDKQTLKKIADSKALKGTMIQRMSKKVKESRAKLKYVE